MKGTGAGHSGHDVLLLVEISEIHASASSGQSEWVEVLVTTLDGKRGIIRVERAPRPDPVTGYPGRVRL